MCPRERRDLIKDLPVGCPSRIANGVPSKEFFLTTATVDPNAEPTMELTAMI